MHKKNRMPSSSRPKVVVTGPDKYLPFAWWATRFSLWLQGIEAFYVTPKKSCFPEDVEGVVIGGGDDIEPEHYGLMGDAGSKYNPARDALEMQVIRCALEAQVPIMGICRGSQLINIVKGGSLFMDIRPKRKHTPNRNSLFKIKQADIAPDSQLAKAMPSHELSINSLHKQAIEHLGNNLKIAAHDRDGFIQAIEGTGTQFVLGVQWHPEYLFYDAVHRRLFKYFSQAVRGTSNTFSRKALM